VRVAQIVLPDASQYERKCQRVDAAALAGRHEALLSEPSGVAGLDAGVAHVYAGTGLPAAPFVRFPIPYVASADAPRSRWRLRQPVAPTLVVSPLAGRPGEGRLQTLPEAVEERYFAELPPRPRGEVAIVGSAARPTVATVVERTVARLARFRSDVVWHLFEGVPSPTDLAGVDAWVDPAVSESDYDGFTAEALVVGLPVVASRTPINVLRLEQGRTGILVPPDDPNELTHAILTILFKREISESKTQAARQTVSKFRSRQRLRILAHMYDTLIS
jgi:glycosyltransferase involved in cell wall biosynthesis